MIILILFLIKLSSHDLEAFNSIFRILFFIRITFSHQRSLRLLHRQLQRAKRLVSPRLPKPSAWLRKASTPTGSGKCATPLASSAPKPSVLLGSPSTVAGVYLIRTAWMPSKSSVILSPRNLQWRRLRTTTRWSSLSTSVQISLWSSHPLSGCTISILQRSTHSSGWCLLFSLFLLRNFVRSHYKIVCFT